MSTQRARTPGRPASDHAPDTRDQLLAAADRLFAEHGATGVSLRELASEAGVTSAMVHYYFGSKDGLYDAMLERTFERVIERVNALVERGRLDADAPHDPLRDLLEILTSTFAAEPWLPALVVREVLSEGGRLREGFIRNYASRMAHLLPGLLKREIDAGRYRADLDPELAFVSIMGMTIMPFVARPVLERVLEIEYDEAFLRHFVRHTRLLFLEGVER